MHVTLRAVAFKLPYRYRHPSRRWQTCSYNPWLKCQVCHRTICPNIINTFPSSPTFNVHYTYNCTSPWWAAVGNAHILQGCQPHILHCSIQLLTALAASTSCLSSIKLPVDSTTTTIHVLHANQGWYTTAMGTDWDIQSTKIEEPQMMAPGLGYIWGQHVHHTCEFSCKFFVFFTILCDYLWCELDKIKRELDSQP